MRISILAVLFMLSSCAIRPDVPSLESRLESWEGSSINNLARALGEPEDISADWWEWRFTSPGMPSAVSPHSLNNPTGTRCSGCDPNPPATTGYPSTSGFDTKANTISGATKISIKACVYRAYIDGTSIVRIETITISGRCRFDEVPFKS